MKLTRLLLVLTLVLGGVAFSQNCDTTVVDGARLLDGDGLASVTQAALQLETKGADVRVRTLASMDAPTLDVAEKRMEHSCPSWQAPDGSRKSNLIVLMLALRERKSGIYASTKWKRAIDTNWTRIQSENMNPEFKKKNWSGGLVAGLDQLSSLVDSENQSYRSSGTTVINQEKPADLSGLWTFFKWLLFLGALFGAAYAIYRVLQGRSRSRGQAAAAQQHAIMSQNAAARLVTDLSDKFPAWEITEPDKAKVNQAKALFDRGSEAFTRFQQSSLGDPNQSGLSTEQYAAIDTSYSNVYRDLYQASCLMKGIVLESTRIPPSAPAKHSRQGGPSAQRRPPKPPAERVIYAPSSTIERNNTVIVPVPIEPEREIIRERESSPSFSRDRDEDSASGGSSSWGSSSRDDSDSGGSSSFDSSSSSDSGSSSSFDSGSSSGDSGGSSDF